MLLWSGQAASELGSSMSLLVFPPAGLRPLRLHPCRGPGHHTASCVGSLLAALPAPGRGRPAPPDAGVLGRGQPRRGGQLRGAGRARPYRHPHHHRDGPPGGGLRRGRRVRGRPPTGRRPGPSYPVRSCRRRRPEPGAAPRRGLAGPPLAARSLPRPAAALRRRRAHLPRRRRGGDPGGHPLPAPVSRSSGPRWCAASRGPALPLGEPVMRAMMGWAASLNTAFAGTYSALSCHGCGWCSGVAPAAIGAISTSRRRGRPCRSGARPRRRPPGPHGADDGELVLRAGVGGSAPARHRVTTDVVLIGLLVPASVIPAVSGHQLRIQLRHRRSCPTRCRAGCSSAAGVVGNGATPLAPLLGGSTARRDGGAAASRGGRRRARPGRRTDPAHPRDPHVWDAPAPGRRPPPTT